jgi:hypothetical protein
VKRTRAAAVRFYLSMNHPKRIFSSRHLNVTVTTKKNKKNIPINYHNLTLKNKVRKFRFTLQPLLAQINSFATNHAITHPSRLGDRDSPDHQGHFPRDCEKCADPSTGWDGGAYQFWSHTAQVRWNRGIKGGNEDVYHIL